MDAFSNQVFIYKDLSFNDFNIRNIENKEKAKYSTKNNITEIVPVFLPTINHISARNISSSNLTLKATKRYMVRLPGSLFLPLKKMKREIKLIRKKLIVRIETSLKFIFTGARVMRINPDTSIRVAKSIRRNKYIFTVPTRVYHFIKSLTDV